MIKILVDMDDTIEDLLGAWVSWLNRLYGTNVKPDDITSWDMREAFPMLTQREIYAPFQCSDFWDDVKPKPGARETLISFQELGYQVFIVTASHYATLKNKIDRVFIPNFPFISTNDLIITGHKQMIKADILIDDGVHNLIGSDCFKILMTAPHNRDFPAEKYGIVRVDNWDEAFEAVQDRVNTIRWLEQTKTETESDEIGCD